LTLLKLWLKISKVFTNQACSLLDLRFVAEATDNLLALLAQKLRYLIFSSRKLDLTFLQVTLKSCD
jgi:hypothetical protein